MKKIDIIFTIYMWAILPISFIALVVAYLAHRVQGHDVSFKQGFRKTYLGEEF